MYIINTYEIIDICSEHYLLSFTLGAKISSPTLAQILIALNQQEKREITDKELIDIALQYAVDIKELKQLLISKLHILKPLLSRKIPLIYVNSDDLLIEQLISDTLKAEYTVNCCTKDFLDFQTPSLVIYYRQNYSDPDFRRIHQALPDDVYLITCGVLYHQLVIDNLYFNHSGLPTHFSNLHHLMTNSAPAEQSITKNDRLALYRGLYERQIETFPLLPLSPCQRGYMAYSIYQFMARFVKFDSQPTPHDAINWRWQVDLLQFGVQKEVAIMEEQVSL